MAHQVSSSQFENTKFNNQLVYNSTLGKEIVMQTSISNNGYASTLFIVYLKDIYVSAFSDLEEACSAYNAIGVESK